MDISELIIKLADGELSDKEKEKLKQKLYNNPKLMQEYLTHIQLNDFLKKEFGVDDITEIRKKSPEDKSLEAEEEGLEKGLFQSAIDHVKDWKEEKKNTDKEYLGELKDFASLGLKAKKHVVKLTEKQKKSRKKVLMKKWYFVATTIAALFVISFFVIPHFNSPADNSALFAHYYKPYQFVIEQNRNGDPHIDSMVNIATLFYKDSKYQKASEIVTTVLTETSQHIKARFILGLTFVEAQNYTLASDEFKKILKNHDSYHLESKWYLALCYLKLEETNDAIKLLKELNESKNLYQKMAKEILKKIQ